MIVINHRTGDESQLLEACCDIIEVFEDFLDRRGIVLENEDKNQDADASNIYSMDYAELEDGVKDVLDKWGLILDDWMLPKERKAKRIHEVARLVRVLEDESIDKRTKAEQINLVKENGHITADEAFELALEYFA